MKRLAAYNELAAANLYEIIVTVNYNVNVENPSKTIVNDIKNSELSISDKMYDECFHKIKAEISNIVNNTDAELKEFEYLDGSTAFSQNNSVTQENCKFKCKEDYTLSISGDEDDIYNITQHIANDMMQAKFDMYNKDTKNDDTIFEMLITFQAEQI